MKKVKNTKKTVELQQLKRDALLIQYLKDLNNKIHELHKDVNRNNAEVQTLKEEIAMSKGGLKVLAGIAALLGTIFTIWQYILGNHGN